MGKSCNICNNHSGSGDGGGEWHITWWGQGWRGVTKATHVVGAAGDLPGAGNIEQCQGHFLPYFMVGNIVKEFAI